MNWTLFIITYYAIITSLLNLSKMLVKNLVKLKFRIERQIYNIQSFFQIIFHIHKADETTKSFFLLLLHYLYIVFLTIIGKYLFIRIPKLFKASCILLIWWKVMFSTNFYYHLHDYIYFLFLYYHKFWAF